MAALTHNLSRRALLGAAVALPVLSRHPGLDPGSTFANSGEGSRWIPDQVRNDENWRRAVAAFERAEARLRGIEGRSAGASAVEQAALEEEYGDGLGALYAALRRLLRVPAPDVAALAVKIELIVEHEVGTLEGGEACLLALRADARRLVGVA